MYLTVPVIIVCGVTGDLKALLRPFRLMREQGFPFEELGEQFAVLLYAVDNCNLAVDNPDSMFSLIDKNADGKIDESEYNENCEIGYQEEQFCSLDFEEPFGLLDFNEYIQFISFEILPFFQAFDLNNDSKINQEELEKLLDQYFIDYTNLTVYFQEQNKVDLKIPETIAFVKSLPNQMFPCKVEHYCTPSPANMTLDFAILDKDGDGFLSFSESQKLLGTRSWLYLKLRGFDSSVINLTQWRKYFVQILQLKNLFFTPMDVDNDGYWSRDEYTRVNNMYGNPIANIFEKYPMNVEDAFDALFGFPLITTIANFYEADRDNTGTLSAQEFKDYLSVDGLQSKNADSYIQSFGGSLNFTQFLDFTESLPNDLFPVNTVNYDFWGSALSPDYSSNYYYYYG